MKYRHWRWYACRPNTLSVTDSHADYMHPNLGGGFGPGFKVEKGFDFVGK